MQFLVEGVGQFAESILADEGFWNKIPLWVKVVDWFEIVGFPVLTAGVVVFAAQGVLHDDVMCRGAAEQRTKCRVGGEDIIRDPYEYRIWMVAHVFVVGPEKICLEERVLETTG